MNNNDILDLRTVANSRQNNTKKKRKRGDGSKTRKGNKQKQVINKLH